jgi:hypothetical protein
MKKTVDLSNKFINIQNTYWTSGRISLLTMDKTACIFAYINRQESSEQII